MSVSVCMYVCIMKCYLAFKKENPAFRDNMDEPGGHCVNGNKTNKYV